MTTKRKTVTVWPGTKIAFEVSTDVVRYQNPDEAQPVYVCVDCGYATKLSDIKPNHWGFFRSSHTYQPENGKFDFPDYHPDNDCGDDYDGQEFFICDQCGCVESIDYGGEGLCKNCWDVLP